MDRPTKEDLAAIRAMHKWEGQEGFSKTSAWCRMGAVLAEVDALTKNPPHTGEVTRRAIAERDEAREQRDAAIARAEAAEAALAMVLGDRRDGEFRVGDLVVFKKSVRDAHPYLPSEPRRVREVFGHTVRLEEPGAWESIAVDFELVIPRDLTETQRREWMARDAVLPVLPATCGACEHRVSTVSGQNVCLSPSFHGVREMRPVVPTQEPPTWCPLREAKP